MNFIMLFLKSVNKKFVFQKNASEFESIKYSPLLTVSNLRADYSIIQFKQLAKRTRPIIAMMIRNFYSRYTHWNDRKPLLTKCVTAGVLMGFGDLICQNLEKSK